MGGGDDGGKEAPREELKPVPVPNIQTEGWGGVGPTATPQTFHQGAMPAWMDPNRASEQVGHIPGAPNWFGADWWGRSASNPAQMLSPADLMYQEPVAPPAAAGPALDLGDYMRDSSQGPWRDEFGNTDAARYMMMDYSGME